MGNQVLDHVVDYLGDHEFTCLIMVKTMGDHVVYHGANHMVDLIQLWSTTWSTMVNHMDKHGKPWTSIWSNMITWLKIFKW